MIYIAPFSRIESEVLASLYVCFRQRWRYARSNDLAGRSTALTSPCLLLCFASVIVWTENKNFTISERWPLYLFYFDSETIPAALAAFVFCRRRLKKVVNFFEEISASGWPGSRMFRPRSDLAPLLRWCRRWFSFCICICVVWLPALMDIVSGRLPLWISMVAGGKGRIHCWTALPLFWRFSPHYFVFMTCRPR